MSFVRSLTARILRNKARSLEETDIWRLYHLLYFYKPPIGEGGLQTSDGPGSKVKDTLPDQKASLEDQYQFVQSEVNNQVNKRTLDPLSNHPTTAMHVIKLMPILTLPAPGTW